MRSGEATKKIAHKKAKNQHNTHITFTKQITCCIIRKKMNKDEAYQIFIKSITPPRLEFNELDWKEALSANSKRLAQHISAFANLPGGGIMVFGIDQGGHPAGIDEKSMNDAANKIANIAAQGVEPAVRVEHWKQECLGQELLFVKIFYCIHGPVHIRGKGLDNSYVRSGAQTRKMGEAELKEAIIRCSPMKFEEIYRMGIDYLKVIDLEEIRTALNVPLEQINQDKLVDLGIIAKTEQGIFPMNLGIICFGSDLSKIPGYDRYTIRLVRYSSAAKTEAEKDLEFTSGLAKSVNECFEKIMELLPSSEKMFKATRKNVPLYPVKAIREALVNAVVHRDYSRTDTRVIVEIFPHKMEIVSPGGLLPGVDVNRLIDQEPRARNQKLAKMLQRIGLCEERGRGIDIMALECELYGLPAVKFINEPNRFTVVFRAPIKFNDMDKAERLLTLYQHASLNYVLGRKTTNRSLRERFKSNSPVQISRLIKDALEKGLIRTQNLSASPRWIHYVPYWSPKFEEEKKS
jgi:predicted HTH transcriptional regulator